MGPAGFEPESLRSLRSLVTGYKSVGDTSGSSRPLVAQKWALPDLNRGHVSRSARSWRGANPADAFNTARYRSQVSWALPGVIHNLPDPQPHVLVEKSGSHGRSEHRQSSGFVEQLMSNDLQPIEPRTAKEMYLDNRRHEVADATLQAHDYRLKQFVLWCEAEGIDNLNDFSGRDIHRFRVKRREEDELATATMKGQLATLRMFMRFCASIEAVEPGLDEKILLPTTTEEDARDEMLSPERARQVIAHLEQYKYASLEHALIEVLWHTGLRIGAARGLDVRDFNAEEQYLELVHRPNEGTTLKNRAKGERLVSINDRVTQVVEDWLDVNHPGLTDEYDREPLFATGRDRLSRNRGRTIAYQYTRPCIYGEQCPHDRDPDTCDDVPTSRAHNCPSSLSPHPLRRGAITYYLQEKTPEKVVSDRMDVGLDVLDRYYDQRTPKEKLLQRREYLPDE